MDISTSLIAFDKGGSETNPYVISTKPAPFIAEGAVFTVAEDLILLKINKHHPKVAKTLGYIQFGASIGASINNVVVIRRLERQ
jgi:hypothetical protein